MSVIVSKSLDYSSSEVAHGTPSISRIVQQTGATTVTIDAVGGNTSVFEISPDAVINFSKSYLSFTATPTACAAGVFNKMRVLGCPYIRSIQLVTREGLFLCDIQDANRYLVATLPYNTSLNDFLQSDTPTNAYGVAGGISPTLVESAGSSLHVPPLVWVDSSRTTATPLGGIQHMLAGGAAAATPVINWCLNLSVFKDSILGMDLNQWFSGQSVFLNITWDAFGSAGFRGTDLADDGGAGANLATLAGNVTLTNVFLYTSLEANSEAILEARTPRSYNIPFVYTNKLSVVGANHVVNVRYSRAHGSRLQKLYWVPYASVLTTSAAFDHTNIAGAKVTFFSTSLNNQRLQQFDLGTIQAQGFADYTYIRDLIKNTPIAMMPAFYQNWLWIEDFTGRDIEGFHLDGFDLSKSEVLYTIVSQNAGVDLNHHVFAVTLRTISTEGGRVTMM